MDETVQIDIHGNETIATATVDRENKTTVREISYPDSTNAAREVTVNGRLVSTRTKTGVETVFTYDALGRRCSSRSVSGASGERSVAAITHYDAQGRGGGGVTSRHNT